MIYRIESNYESGVYFIAFSSSSCVVVVVLVVVLVEV